MKKAAALLFIPFVLLALASRIYAATAGIVPVCIIVGATANVVPIYEAPAGAGVVPISVVSTAAEGGGTCVPVRVVSKGTVGATPVIVKSGSLSRLMLVDGTSTLLLVDGVSRLSLQ